jgi:hypothetical protein
MKKILFSLLVLLATTTVYADQITFPSFIPIHQITDSTQITVEEVTIVEIASNRTKLLADGQEFILSMKYSDAVCWYLNIHYVALRLGYISNQQFEYLERIYKARYN